MSATATIVIGTAAGLLFAAGSAAQDASGGSGSAAGADLQRIFEEFHAWELRESPTEAMRRGDYTNADRLPDESLGAIERRHADRVEFRRRLETVDRAALREQDLVSLELLDLRIEHDVEEHRFRMFLAPMGARGGPHQTVAEMTEGVRFERTSDYESYIARLLCVPKAIDDAIALMRVGADEGRTPPRVVLVGVPRQFEAILEGDGLDALAEPFDRMPARFSDAERETLRRRFDIEAMGAVRAALEKLRTFFVEEYLPRTRVTIAAADLPDGKAYYAQRLWSETTTRKSARAIHELGLDEVARLRREMMEVIRRSDYLAQHADQAELGDEELFRNFLAYLRTDPRFYHQSEEALLAGYRDICKRVDAWLPHLFRTLPRLPYGVKKIPDFMAPQQTTAYYNFGSIENGEPGWFFANTYALDQRPKYEMIPLALHEAVPGHHLQSALAMEMESVPEFRKHTWFTSFGEGWALYAERLGIEMGLYEDPYDDFGRLLYEMWRACRLVVDPGIHALGWSREQAVEFMERNTALSELNIANEVDRYIAWPGQACAYKIGELEIRALRREAEETLRAEFDLRAFHDVVLGAGSVPLDVLERRVRAWIRSHPAGAMYD